MSQYNVINHSVKLPVRLHTKEIPNLRQSYRLTHQCVNLPLTCTLFICTHSFSQEAHNDHTVK